MFFTWIGEKICNSLYLVIMICTNLFNNKEIFKSLKKQNYFFNLELKKIKKKQKLVLFNAQGLQIVDTICEL